MENKHTNKICSSVKNKIVKKSRLESGVLADVNQKDNKKF